MRLLSRLALAAVLLAAPALAENITLSGTGNWSNATTYSGTVSGGTLSADDDITITGTVTITGDVAQDGTTAATGIVVASGGTLNLNVGASATTELKLSLNEDGLEVQSGGTFNAGGRFICPGNATLTTSTSPCGWVYVNRVLMPTGTSDEIVRLSFPDAENDSVTTVTDPGESRNTETVGLLQAGDLIRFGDDDESDPWAPMEDNYWYEITAVNTSGDDYIDISIRQGDRDTNQSLASRDIAFGQLAADVVVGARTISIDDATITASGQYEGRCLYFEDGTTAVPETKAYKILRSTEAATDTLLLGALDGARTAHASGDDYWIGYCINRGDPFQIIRPAVVTSATAGQGDSRVLIQGTSTIKAVLFDDIGGDGNTSNGAPIHFNTTDPTSFSYVWNRDPSGTGTGSPTCPGHGNREAVFFNGVLPADRTVSYYSVTGGDARTSAGPVSCDRMHGMSLTDTPDNFIGYEISCRHNGDDCFVHIDTSAAGLNATRGSLSRVRGQFLSNDGSTSPSAQVFDLTTAGTSSQVTWTVNGAECTACVANNEMTALVDNTNATYSTVNDYVVWAASAYNSYLVAGCTGACAFTKWSNLFVLGGNPYASSDLMPNWVENFVVRDTLAASSGTRTFQQANGLVTTEPLILRNGLVRDSTFPSTTFLNAQAGAADNVSQVVRENLLLYNLKSSNTGTCSGAGVSCPMVGISNLNDASVPLTVRYLSLIHVGAVASPDYTRGFFHVGGTADGAEDVSGILIQGFAGGPGSTATSTWGANVPASRPWCLFGNTTDWASGPTNVANQVRDRALGLYQPVAVAPSSAHRGSASRNSSAECGAKANAGITTFGWAQAVNGLTPEYAGKDFESQTPRRISVH